MKGIELVSAIFTKEGYRMPRFYYENPHPALLKRAKKLLHDIHYFREDCFYADDLFLFYKFARDIRKALDDAEVHNEYWPRYSD